MTPNVELPEIQRKISQAISQFVTLLDKVPDKNGNHLRHLAQVLDHLVMVYWDTDNIDTGSSDHQAPRHEYADLYDRVGKAFPELGYYPCVYPGDDLQTPKASLADGIDDIADIARDLHEVEWLLENASLNEAIWMFRFGYQTHWGPHLHSLRHYLNTAEIGAW